MNDDDLAARLRAADPAAHLAPADPDQVHRLLEDTMSTESHPDLEPETLGTDTGAGPRRRVLPWLAAVAAAVVVAGVGFALLDTGEDPAPPAASQGTVTRLTMATPQGRCMAPDATTLAQAQTAFAGTVTAVSDGMVTLRPSTWYAGDHTDEVTVRQVDTGLKDLVGAVDFQQGKDYLVAANNGAVMVCGFSGEQTSGLTSLYEQAFSGASG